MAGRRTICRSSQSIVGVILVGLGMFILYENLAGAVAWLSHVLGANGSETLGVPAAFVLTASQAVHCCSRDHQWVLQSLLPQILVSSWPLLLVTFGRVLSREDKSIPVAKSFTKGESVEVQAEPQSSFSANCDGDFVKGTPLPRR